MKNLGILCLLFAVGCGKSGAVNQNPGQPAPKSFTVANSEYPSWSTLSVAADKGLIDPKQGGLGSIEKKWNVDIVLKTVDYDSCLSLYGSNTIDAVCITNMDCLNSSLGRRSTAIVPTSTSFGADACLGIGIDGPEQLKEVETMMLTKSVSEYVFVRCLEKQGLNPADFKITSKDPGAAATAMQTGQAKAIMVWNPFVLQTLRLKPEAKRLFDSTLIPGEIVDMMVVGNDVLGQPSGEAFANALADTFYAVNKLLADPATADETYVDLGKNFCKLPLEDMKICCQETKFYSTPEAGVEVFSGEEFRNNNEQVVKTCLDRGIITKAPKLGYDDATADLNFSTKYMKTVEEATSRE